MMNMYVKLKIDSVMIHLFVLSIFMLCDFDFNFWRTKETGIMINWFHVSFFDFFGHVGNLNG